jgi:hypothetical protein
VSRELRSEVIVCVQSVKVRGYCLFVDVGGIVYHHFSKQMLCY